MDRLARHFLHRNPDTMKDAELLELLLRFAVPEPEALARRLLEHYPSLASILEADAEELAAVEGMTPDCVVLLRLVPELQRRYLIARSAPETRLVDSTSFGSYLLPYFYGAKDEIVYLLTLDATGKVLSCRLIGRGSVNSANVPMRRLVQEDIDLTLRLRDALDVMDILLLDHLVIADDDYVSMNDSGYLRRGF